MGAPVMLEVDSVRKALDVRGAWLDVLDSVSLSASDGDWVTVIGPSGCGKTTLLRIIAGLLEPDDGNVFVNGECKHRLGSAALLPQSDTLLPWRTAVDNAVLASEIAGIPRATALAEATRLFERFGLSGFETMYPWQLSGGMQQRVALMRTFLSGRAILLLDEPLGALDPLTRASMQDWLLAVWNELRKTIVLVTHDVEEAVVLSDRLVVLTPRPARVLSEWSFEDLPRPRSRGDLAFMRRRAEILAVLLGGTA
ncbi:MAG: ABC transporter ATP-binding protein [Candidatus Bipolaricaulota bacterium]|nr:ABC transporter ATP-binding protein [Candidatus Bipolaricaulota bacterium]